MVNLKIKKILIIISSYKTCLKGVGGHYISAINYYNALISKYSVEFLVVGSMPSPSVVSSGIPHRFQRLSNDDLVKYIFELKRYIIDTECNIVITFDEMAFVATRIATIQCKKIKFLNIKPGGGKPSKFYATGENLVVFSIEDLKHFENKSCKLILFSNRVMLNQNRQHENKKLPWKSKDSLKVLSICRVARSKSKHFHACINLSKMLSAAGVNFEMILLGAIQDNVYYSELKVKNQYPHIYYITSPDFTNMAMEYIADCDLAVVMGRSVPEALIKERPVCVPTSIAKYPVFLDTHSYEKLSSSNFSFRANLTENYNNFDQLHEKIRNWKLHTFKLIYSSIKKELILDPNDNRLIKIVSGLTSRNLLCDLYGAVGAVRLFSLLWRESSQVAKNLI